MKSFRPRSILQLTITGFLAITVLYVVAFFLMSNQFNKLSLLSQQMINDTANSTRTGSELIEEIIAMERNARQYMVLGDKDLLEIYITRRKEFIKSANRLAALNINNEVNIDINKLLKDERDLFKKLSVTPVDKSIISAYPLLLDLSYKILTSIDKWIDEQLIELGQQARNTQHFLTLQAAFLLIIALLLALIFTLLITKPLRQIYNAINYLGGSKYDDPIQIQGPRDLQELGFRLDWLRNRLNELEQQRTFFMRHISHELKTPLAAIREGTALLKDGVIGPVTDQQNDIINILYKNCRRLQELIENLLRYKVESLAVLKPMSQPVKLDEVIERVITDHRLSIEKGEHKIVLKVEKLTVQGDQEQLRVVVDNLISNALKYSPGKGKIELRLIREQGNAALEIHDEGPGIPKAEQNKVFEPYYQGNPPDDQRHLHGSGLGLAIAKEYVEINGGAIEVVDVEHGACIRIQLPIIKKL